MSTDVIELWHQRARPFPNEQDFNVQLGCHFEEFVEMLDTLDFESDGTTFELLGLVDAMREFSNALKSGEVKARIVDRKELLDSLADQVVTSVGVGHCANMKITEGIRRVNASNWSKFDRDGQPIRNAHGKIAKGPDYAPPNLEGLY